MPVPALVDALASLDEIGARAVLDCYALVPEEVARSVMDATHELWRRQRDGVVDGAVVAAATALARRLLSSRSVAPIGGRGAPVTVMSPVVEAHRIDADAVAAALRGSGWSVDQVSGPVMAQDLCGFLTGRDAHALAVVCAGAEGLGEVAAALGAAQRAGIPAVVTGRVFGADDLRALRLGADAWAPDLGSLLSVMTRWAEHRPESGQVTAAPAECTLFERERFAIVAAADATMSDTPGFDDRLRQELAALVTHLAAAVLVDDSRVLLEFVTTTMVEPNGQDEAAQLLDALALALPDGLVRSRDFVDDARRHLRHAFGSGGRLPPCAAPSKAPSWTRPVGLGDSGEGQVFADLLLLGATACQVPIALSSVRRPGGGWSTLSFGVERRHLPDPEPFFDLVAQSQVGIEVGDLLAHPELSQSPLVGPPICARWFYGIPVGGPDGTVLGVFCVIDRMTKQASRREQRALLAIGRQFGEHLEQWRRRRTPAGSVAVDDGPAARRPGALANLEFRSEGPQLLRSHEVAALFDVTDRTVINWAASGKLASLRTMGGHLRFRRDEVAALLASGRSDALRSG